VCTIRLAHTLWLQGHHQDAARTRDAALALAEASDHPYSRTLVTLFAALIALEHRDEKRLRTHVHDLAATGSGPAENGAEAFAGFVAVLDGRPKEGLARVLRAVDQASSDGPSAPGEEGLLLRILLEACVVAGDAQAGIEAADRALRTTNAAQPWTAEVRRLRSAFQERSMERLGNAWQ
jgi:hypothetical protein